MTAADALRDLVLTEIPARVDAFATALDDGRLDLRASRVRIERVMPPGRFDMGPFQRLLTAWRELDGATPRQLAVAVRAATAVREGTEERGPVCELAWTGRTVARDVRNTSTVVEEMLGRTRRDVLMLQYAINLGDSTDRIVTKLAELAREGVDTTILLDARWQDGRSLRSLRRHWPVRSPRPQVWDYTDADDEYGKLHAKVLLTDGRDLLVTSANLTAHGLQGNIEFGVRVQGPPAVQARAHFDDLIRSGTLRRVEW